MQSILPKLTSDNPTDVIENYEEISQVLSNTPFAQYLGP